METPLIISKSGKTWTIHENTIDRDDGRAFVVKDPGGWKARIDYESYPNYHGPFDTRDGAIDWCDEAMP